MARVEIGRLCTSDMVDRNTKEPVYDATGRQRQRAYLALGVKGSNKKYNTTVEIVVKDADGVVIATQRDFFVELVDPRLEPDDLLKAGIITEEQAEQKRGWVSKLNPNTRYKLMMEKAFIKEEQK